MTLIFRLIKNFIWMLRVKSELSFERYRLEVSKLFLNELIKDKDVDELREQMKKLRNEATFLDKKKDAENAKEKATEAIRVEQEVNAYEERFKKLKDTTEILRQNKIYKDILKNNWKQI